MSELETGICIGLVAGMIITFVCIEIGINIRGWWDDLFTPPE